MKFVHETSYMCCSNGQIALVSNKIPDILKELLISSSEEAKEFRNLIRTYNNIFAFTSFGVKCDKDLVRRNNDIYTFKVQGQVCHFLNDLIPKKDKPSNLQLYFYDTENELTNRVLACPKVSETTLEKIMDMLKCNPYAKFFKSLTQIENIDNYHIVLRSIPNVDQRVFNKPTASQVAALWVDGEENVEKKERDIKIYTHSGLPKKVQYYYGCYDPLQYPLIFPY